MKNNIALIGFMGAGKSTAGRELAARLKMKYVEMDSAVEKKAGKSIAEIFRNDGEAAFRRLESEIVSKTVKTSGSVISCGGGVVLDHRNIEQLKKNAVVVYLQARQDVIMERVQGSSDVRPLLKSSSPLQTVAGLLKTRCPLYEQAADITVDTSGLEIKDVVDKIIACLPEEK